MSIAENIARVRANIAAAAKEAGRDVSEITLVGASKMNDADACRAAIAAGIDVLGENREQEMTKKLAEHAYDGAPLHFIGHLQRNKVKNVVGKVAMIESVGSLELLSAIDKQAEKLGINAKLYDNTLDILSMGMSGDYEDAVRAGATMVRVGTAIFGARNYTI